MARAEISPAPGWRRTLAGLVDVAIALGMAWRRRPRVGSAAVSGQNRSAALSRPVAELVREQLGSPGQRLLGVRTVDRRTGRRVELWRTLVLFGAGVGGQLLARRLTPALQTPEQKRQRELFMEELKALNERHPVGSRERDSEMSALMERQPGQGGTTPLRTIGPSLAFGLVNSALRRRLARTTEVLVRPR
jgi:hypothetical protein